MTAAVAVRERPLLMSGPMVRATLDGRKSQTRRVVDLKYQQLLSDLDLPEARNVRVVEGGIRFDWLGGIVSIPLPTRYGVVGDHLYVREAHRYRHESDWIAAEGSDAEDVLVDQEHIRYEENLRIGMRRDRERGDLVERVTYLHESTAIEDDNWLRAYKRRPSIHMPRWASRITLEITNVRVERLQSISYEDAKAEGMGMLDDENREEWSSVAPPGETTWPTIQQYFERLWDSLNADRGYGWDSNPWCWVIEFRRVTP